MYRFALLIFFVTALAGCDDASETAMQPTMRVAPKPADEPPPPGLVEEGADWETITEGYIFSEGPATDAAGNVFYAEPVFGHLYVIDTADNITQIDQNTEMTMGLVMGADGFIYACRNRAAQIVRYSTAGEYEVLLQGELTPLKRNPNAPGEFCNDLAINQDGGIWFTDRVNRQVIYLAPDGSSRVVAEGWRPNGIVLSADRSMIVVTDSARPLLHAFRVGENGSLTELPGFFDTVRTVDALESGQDVVDARPGSDGMTVDSDGRFYLASFYGVQVFGPDGKYIGVIRRPTEFVSNLTFGGADRRWLYATGRLGLFRIRMQVEGVGW